MKMSSTLHCKCLWTKSINNSILLFIFVHHININFFLSIFNKNFGMKNNLLSTILFLIKNFTFLKTPLILKKFLKKKELYRHKSNWLILSVVMRKTKIIEMEFKKRNLQNEISKLNNIFLKKKRVLLKKFEKFYQDYLGVTLKISNNIFVWKFLDYNGIGKKKIFIIMVKIKRIYCFNLKIPQRIGYPDFLKKEIKRRNSVSRALLLLK